MDLPRSFVGPAITPSPAPEPTSAPPSLDSARRRATELGVDEDGWDRYVAAQWFTVRAWLDENPDDELAAAFRAELDTAPLRYVRYQRRYLGWGVFALKRR